MGRNHLCFFALLFSPFILFALLACQPPIGHSGLGKQGCKRCHDIRLDPNHSFACTSCHRGQAKGYVKDQAHKGLVRHPASPENAKIFCARCHEKEYLSAQASIHYSLKKEIGKIWQAFFPGDMAPPIKAIRGVEKPDTKRAIIMDALARRCLRCHVYYQGESYKGTHRGTGCAACHMDVGRTGHHILKKPRERNCLSCHYANFIGWDYEGRFEKDYPEDFRAPLCQGRHIPRPYGVEWIHMEPDVHKKAGMTCLDCHDSQPFHKTAKKKTPSASCIRCHILKVDIVGHRQEDIPRAKCSVCHAVWGVLDLGRNLLRQDEPDLEEWQFLKVEGSSEIETILDRWANSATLPPSSVFTMTDKISGKPFPGLWFAAFEQRRWAPVVLGTDRENRISVIRPLLDLSISYENSEEETLFDAIKPGPEGPASSTTTVKIVYPSYIQIRPLPKSYLWLPYHPHTIGEPDVFRTRFVQTLLESKISP